MLVAELSISTLRAACVSDGLPVSACLSCSACLPLSQTAERTAFTFTGFAVDGTRLCLLCIRCGLH